MQSRTAARAERKTVPNGVDISGTGSGCPSQAAKAEAIAALKKQLFSLGVRKGKGLEKPEVVRSSLVLSAEVPQALAVAGRKVDGLSKNRASVASSRHSR